MSWMDIAPYIIVGVFVAVIPIAWMIGKRRYLCREQERELHRQNLKQLQTDCDAVQGMLAEKGEMEQALSDRLGQTFAVVKQRKRGKGLDVVDEYMCDAFGRALHGAADVLKRAAETERILKEAETQIRMDEEQEYFGKATLDANANADRLYERYKAGRQDLKQARSERDERSNND